MKLIVLLFLSKALAGAILHQDAPISDVTIDSSQKLLDSFHESGLGFSTWIEVMEANEMIFRPDLPEDSAVRRSDDGSWRIKLKNAGCSQITGNADTITRTRQHVCDKFIHQATTIYAKKMVTDVSQLICDDHHVCQLGVKVTMDFFRVNEMADDITSICNGMFDQLNSACPGGGVGELEISDDQSTLRAEIEMSYSLEDGSHCEPSQTQECYSGKPPS